MFLTFLPVRKGSACDHWLFRQSVMSGASLAAGTNSGAGVV
jgi:hypothetical protein